MRAPSKPSPERCPLCERPNLHPSDHHMVPRSQGGRSTTTLCRDCHAAIHATFSNKELAREYASVEALRAHADFSRTLAFIASQDPGGRVRTAPARRRRRS